MEYEGATDEESMPERVRTLNHLGITYAHVGRNDEAEQAYLESLELRLSMFDERHPRVGSANANLAAFYHGTSQFDKARRYALEAVGGYMARRRRGRAHTLRLRPRQARGGAAGTRATRRGARDGEIELHAGNVSAAERHASRLLQLVEANEPENTIRLRRALTVLRQVLEASGDAQRLRAVETRLAALSL